MAPLPFNYRSPQYQRLIAILCDFAGVENKRIRRIAVDIDCESGDSPEWIIEKFADVETAASAIDKHTKG